MKSTDRFVRLDQEPGKVECPGVAFESRSERASASRKRPKKESESHVLYR